MNNKDGKIVFRRIRGRIVPIRKKQAATAAGTIAAGAGIAYGAGKTAGAMVHVSAQAENAARKFVARTQAAVAKSKQPFLPGLSDAVTTGLMNKSKNMFKASRRLSNAGQFVGGVIVGSGISQLYESISGQKVGLKEEVIAQSAGQLTASALELGFVQSTQSSGKLFKALRLVAKNKLKL